PPFALQRPRPLFYHRNRAVEVPVCLPVGIEHRRLRRDPHVFGERRQDLLVPRLLRKRERAADVERHHRVPFRAVHTRSGLSGMSRCLTPNVLRASTTALTTAGVLPIVAASPMPL